jgi:hypothetical protein
MRHRQRTLERLTLRWLKRPKLVGQTMLELRITNTAAAPPSTPASIASRITPFAARPIRSAYERYERTRRKADEVDEQGLFGAFFELIETLGWRVDAVCRLWASDVDRSVRPAAAYGPIRKRGEVDKEGVEMWVPMNEDARRAVDVVLERNPAIGGTPLFPAPKSDADEQSKCWSRWHARDLNERSQRSAGYATRVRRAARRSATSSGIVRARKCRHVDREPRDPSKRLLGFHAYRRKWATERKHLPVKDVAEAGGWLDRRSLELCYLQADEETMLAAVSEPRKLRETIAQTIAPRGG